MKINKQTIAIACWLFITPTLTFSDQPNQTARPEPTNKAVFNVAGCTNWGPVVRKCWWQNGARVCNNWHRNRYCN